jgi:hypothetical protein
LPAPGWSTLWAGNDNALLSIFRHFDSASVNKGLIGEVPQTMWLFDYPLLERTYYQLVVNFDVFGNVSHQAQTPLVLRPDPQWRRTELPAPDAGQFAGRFPRRLVSERRQGQVVDGL